MKFDFSEVTDEQLAQLFPVILVPHDLQWAKNYDFERKRLLRLFGSKILRISHIGSSAVKGLMSKPTIDILLEVDELTSLASMRASMLNLGYIINTPKQDLIMFLKGYTPTGTLGQSYHIHVRYLGDWDELYFKDYLMEFEYVALEYEKLKCLFASKFTYDRDGYTEAKSEFVLRVSRLAKEAYGNRYSR